MTDTERPKLRLFDRIVALVGVPSATDHGRAMTESREAIRTSSEVQVEAQLLLDALQELEDETYK